MSNQSVVIELGSSDDEPEPKSLPKPPRKFMGNQNTTKVKNTPNAMVHIPAGVSIRPAKKNTKANLKPVNIKPGVKSFIPLNPPVLTPVTITPSYNKATGNVVKPYGKNRPTINQQRSVNQTVKISKNINPFNLLKVNARGSGPTANSKKNQNIIGPSANSKNFQNIIGPSANSKNFQNIIGPSANSKNFQNIVGPSANSKNSQNIKILPKLPAGITITKTKSQMGLKRPAIPNPSVAIKKKKVAGSLPIETVTLDDEDPLSLHNEPRLQWYMPPDENKETNTNEEPANPNFIEITIEDSPIKPKNKQNTVTSITVDDSPFKQTKQNTSDDQPNKVKNKPDGKKKLYYSTPVTAHEQQNDEDCSIEIELVPMSVDNEAQNNVDTMPSFEDNNKQEDVSSTKQIVQADKPKTSTEKTKQKDVTNTVMENTNIGDKEEFHPVYQQFMDLCLELENSNDMKVIIEKKIKAYYRQVPKDYTESEDFIDMVQTKMDLMRSVPKDMYLFIKDIVDQLNSQRKKEKYAQSSAAKEKKEEYDMVEVPEHDSKRARQIKKLEKTLKKLHRAIQKLEEQEVDFDDDGDSVYILTERYKERVVKVHAKLCQLTNSKMPSLPRIEIECRPGQPSGPAKRLNKWLNRRLPPGTPSPFPDFHDVLRCVREANDKDKLGWNEVDVMEEARDLFTRCGKKLQRRRQENEWRIAASRLTTYEDPANVSADLQKKLEENRKVAAQKESELINKFADRQKQLKLEAEEITEKEAEESPAESEDDVAIISDEEDNALEDKERRKQRLVKFLKGKSKHKSDKKTKGDNNIDSKAIDVNNDESHRNDEEEAKETERTESKKDENTTRADPEADKTEVSIAGSVDEKTKSKKSSDKDSNEVNSDMDELHLLQKHHSENEGQSSDDSFIDISDSMESNTNSVSDNKNSPHSVYSIEDSSSSNNDQIESMNENSGNENNLNELQDQDKGNEDEAHDKVDEIQENDNDSNKNATRENHLNDENSHMTINSESQSIDIQKTTQESKTDDANSKDYEIHIQNDNAMDVDYSKEQKGNEENNGLQNLECGDNDEVITPNSVDNHDMECNREEAMNVCEDEKNDHEKDNVDKNETNDIDKIANDNGNEINANDNETNIQECSNDVNDSMFEFEIPLIDNYNSAVEIHLEGEL